MLGHVSVRGEISNLKFHSTGHLYFSIKDPDSNLRCVMFGYKNKVDASSISEGMQVVVSGKIDAYERDGSYQLYASSIVPEGKGKTSEEFEKLKNKLQEMGMFDESYKQPIPHHPRTIGVVTAPTGAAIRDIINVSKSRDPYVQIILYPAIVQGDQAPQSVIKGIKALEAKGVDVIIVGRGGGSQEDLWAFNDEALAETIFNCMTPIISGVGHEIDFTIADFVADKRAATPSQAAEMATSDVVPLLRRIDSFEHSLYMGFDRVLSNKRHRYEMLLSRLSSASPIAKLENNKKRLSEIDEKLQTLMNKCIEDRKHTLSIYAERLQGMSPLEKLSQGYAHVSDENGNTVNDVDKINTGDDIKIYVKNGRIGAKVTEVIHE